MDEQNCGFYGTRTSVRHDSLQYWSLVAAITPGIGLMIALFKRLAIRRISGSQDR